jgi:hypothetical protein
MNDQLLLRQDDRLCCINLDGHVIYRYDISGWEGLAVDQQGHDCMDFSCGRVTTALFVHGTTVIHKGSLVNDNLSS